MTVRTTLKLPKALWKAVKMHIDAAPDVEVCGLIGGVWRRYPHLAEGRAVQAIPNSDPHPATRYRMEPRAQLAAMLAFEKQGWEVVGIYHSHPTGKPRPSRADLAEATYPDALYLIGVPQGALCAWRVVGGVARAALVLIEAPENDNA